MQYQDVNGSRISHGVNQLEVSICKSENGTWPICSSNSLTSLKLESWSRVSCPFLSGSFKNLTVLYLRRATITTLEPFSGFQTLEKLTLHQCHLLTDSKTLGVHALKLSDLTISGWWFDRYELTTPNLRFFDTVMVSLPVLDTVLIDFSGVCFRRHDEERLFDGLISLFRFLHNGKSLTLFPDTVNILSLFPEKLVNLNSPFCNLKCLNLDLRYDCEDQSSRWSFEMHSKVKAYLLRNSPHHMMTCVVS